MPLPPSLPPRTSSDHTTASTHAPASSTSVSVGPARAALLDELRTFERPTSALSTPPVQLSTPSSGSGLSGSDDFQVAWALLPPLTEWTHVGSGHFGVVYTCVFRGAHVCVKCLSSASNAELELCFREFALIHEAVCSGADLVRLEL